MPTSRQRLFAWGVHAFTLSGLACATLATLALMDRNIKAMWLWLGIALIVDAVDGTLARKARVKEVIPWFDGGIVDIVVDYLTWTFIPAAFMYTMLPLGPRPVALALIVLVLVSSMFCYANEEWKSTDYYFVGFPAAWNIVAVIMYILGTGAVLNIVATVVLAVLTLTPTYYTHPFRVRRMMAVNIAAISVWIASVAYLVAVAPARPAWALAAFWVTGGWFLLTCAWRTVTGADRPRRPVHADL